jgi:hypothetical protein
MVMGRKTCSFRSQTSACCLRHDGGKMRGIISIGENDKILYHNVKAAPVIMTNSRLRAQVRFFVWCTFHSALATFIKRSSSFTGIQLVRAFIAFSKSLSRRISRVPSIKAALAAWSTSKPPPKGRSVLEGVEISESPSSINTSQTRSCAGKGIE